ncbi:chorismate mutase [Actinoplanes oblitus]|uniref:Chorismate mutase n=1 Tax=Actinoplanes oblitus TaxID=3040509 RepID=A0ABY8W6S2_9ACTN|nr:chorismate mutase [Actinoplanes oblitus]WIM93531.1 chorismate mutase [Actinoplanes oblitus]
MSAGESPLAGVRREIDAIDGELVRLLAAREVLVRRAGALKRDEQAVRAPGRVEEVIAKVRGLAAESGASPEVVERVYRAMIGAFVDLELAQHRADRRP